MKSTAQTRKAVCKTCIAQTLHKLGFTEECPKKKRYWKKYIWNDALIVRKVCCSHCKQVFVVRTSWSGPRNGRDLKLFIILRKVSLQWSTMVVALCYRNDFHQQGIGNWLVLTRAKYSTILKRKQSSLLVTWDPSNRTSSLNIIPKLYYSGSKLSDWRCLSKPEHQSDGESVIRLLCGKILALTFGSQWKLFCTYRH